MQSYGSTTGSNNGCDKATGKRGATKPGNGGGQAPPTLTGACDVGVATGPTTFLSLFLWTVNTCEWRVGQSPSRLML